MYDHRTTHGSLDSSGLRYERAPREREGEREGERCRLGVAKARTLAQSCVACCLMLELRRYALRTVRSKPSVRLSVPSINSSGGGRRVCC